MIKTTFGVNWFRSIGLLLIVVSMSAVLLIACSTGSTGSTQTQVSGYQTTVKTSDGLYLVQFRVTPNRQGLNTFIVTPTTSSGGKPISTMQVHLDTTMLDMDMGTNILTLQGDKNGTYSGQSTLTMAGNWQMRIVLHTSDGKSHETSVKFTVKS